MKEFFRRDENKHFVIHMTGNSQKALVVGLEFGETEFCLNEPGGSRRLVIQRGKQEMGLAKAKDNECK